MNERGNNYKYMNKCITIETLGLVEPLTLHFMLDRLQVYMYVLKGHVGYVGRLDQEKALYGWKSEYHITVD